ncbi:4-hydroxy-3-methylbut-2-enyl diphosphate reductase [Dellaglioa algida]|uniref:LSM domain-containing protein n=1 Tax=Dellaglioa algida TaxID=105612 RepID=A0A5C6MB99_9LACO|nr:4-hydroxy-3-methylbut-2-enyl diphosphate reductase [Dellaglioa algida]MDK1716625.1 4-hydroxy-3-methylbut-2-enyl diphosphate reductase [Dellaglioa algida]MDK1720218.1 4-hydroxy-3-methylbut-2-enyl diphosphate reductase [Dellaglioa algida]MDK1721567.1 4-hydroxy-3-methylbut-2-enyl diphosphate reductase [Dellaglioa algida]MDK1723608.1 4-hydroxy-3-methylbut-2-enyl diphosphate reductase [Dellaglioa algida]TWW10244.1 hypothetical protein LABALGLTS371_15320 [Dellaglioa algida]
MLKLWEYVDQEVVLTLINGNKVKGKVIDWTDDETSISGEQEISIGSHIYAKSDFKNIKLKHLTI